MVCVCKTVHRVFQRSARISQAWFSFRNIRQTCQLETDHPTNCIVKILKLKTRSIYFKISFISNLTKPCKHCQTSDGKFVSACVNKFSWLVSLFYFGVNKWNLMCHLIQSNHPYLLSYKSFWEVVIQLVCQSVSLVSRWFPNSFAWHLSSLAKRKPSTFK